MKKTFFINKSFKKTLEDYRNGFELSCNKFEQLARNIKEIKNPTKKDIEDNFGLTAKEALEMLKQAENHGLI